METLKELEEIVKQNLKTNTDVGAVKEIKADTKNLEAIKTVKKLAEIYAV